VSRELEMVRAYMDSAPEPTGEHLDFARRNLNDMIHSGPGPHDPRKLRIERPHKLIRGSGGAFAAGVAAVALVIGLLSAYLVSTSSHPVTAAQWKVTGHLLADPSMSSLSAGQATAKQPFGLTCPTASGCLAFLPSAGLTDGTSATNTEPPATSVEISGDSGSTWQTTYVPPAGMWLDRMSCPSSTTCFATGVNISSHTYAAATTTDGGVTWNAITIPTASGGGGATEISCTSTTDCVVIEGGAGPDGLGVEDSTYVTADGGQTWTTAAVPGTFRANSLECFTGDTCIATGMTPSTYQITNPSASTPAGAIYSTDGGFTWTASQVTQTWPGGGSIVAMSCSNAQDCLATEVPNGQGGDYALVSTEDGGKSWAPLDGNLPSDLTLLSIACPTMSNCSVAGSDDSTGTGVVFNTTDGGQTWNSVPLPTVEGVVPNEVMSLTCGSASSCHAVAIVQDSKGDATTEATLTYSMTGATASA